MTNKIVLEKMYLELDKALREARTVLNNLSPGFFIKIGKTVQHDKVVWWVMVPVVDKNVEDSSG